MTRPCLVVLVLAGCAVGPSDPSTDPDDDAQFAQFSATGRAVIDALQMSHAGARGVTWQTSIDNTFAADWVVQTPPARYWGQPTTALAIATACDGKPGCDPDFNLLACASQADCTAGGTCREVAATVTRPGAAARKLCVGHSDELYDRIYGLVAGAQHTVEISSLSPPDGRFEAALRNAVTFLGASGRDVRVRYLFGAVIGDSFTTDGVLASLVRDIGTSAGVHVAVAALRDGALSWDHAKAIVIDGATAMVGGHNWWTRHYLQQAPVHDLSMTVTGTAAYDVHAFIDALWRHACVPPVTIGSVAVTSGDRACEPLALQRAPQAAGARMIAVGRLGSLGDEASDSALVALVSAATHTLHLSLQDIGPVGAGAAWPEPYLRALADAAGRGVDIELIVTNLQARPDGLSAGSSSYSNGWTPADIYAHVLPFGDASAICAHLHIATLRQGSDDLWPNGGALANHAKLVIADDETFYLGSQNWYPSNLAEIGYVVDDAPAANQLVSAYFTPAWTMSSRTLASCP